LNLLLHLPPPPPCHLCPPFSILQWNKHDKLLHLFLFYQFSFWVNVFGSGFGKSQLCNSVSNLGLSFSVLISFFCNRSWRCWRFATELRWCYGWEIAFLLITLFLSVLQIESMRSCCIWNIVIQNELLNKKIAAYQEWFFVMTFCHFKTLFTKNIREF